MPQPAAPATTDDLRATLTRELQRHDLQQYTVCRVALLDLNRGNLQTAIARLRVDADKFRCYDTDLNEILKTLL